MPDPIPALAGLSRYWRGDTGRFQDAAGTIPATTQAMARWDDTTGNGSLRQTTSGLRPVATADSGYKSQPGVAFDRASGQFMVDAAFQGTDAVSAGTWIVAFDRAHNGQAQFIVDPAANQALTVLDLGGTPTLVTSTSQQARFRDNAYHGKLAIFRYDGGLAAGSRVRLRLNRTERTVTTIGAPGTTSASTTAGLAVGAAFDGTNGLAGQLLALAYVSRAITDVECDAIDAYFAEGYFAETAKKLFVLGDSIPFGYPNHTGDGQDWPTRLGVLLGSPWTVQVNAAVAQTITQMENSGVAQIDPDYDDWRARQAVILQCGTNDGFQKHTAAQALTDMATSVTNRHAQGFTEVYVQTLPYAQASGVSAPATDAEYEAFRAAYNAGVLAGNTGADHMFNLQARTGWDAPPNLGFYEGDHVHPNATGNADIAQAGADLLAPPAAPPAPTFTSTPTDPSASTGDVSFAFTSVGATSFECSLDGSSYATCTSPKAYTGLAAGAHTFAVRAVNAGGTSSPASFSWSVSTPPLLPALTAGVGTGVGLRRGGRP